MEKVVGNFIGFLLSVVLGTWWFFGWGTAYWVLVAECILGGIVLIFWIWVSLTNAKEKAALPWRAEEKLRSIVNEEVEKHVDVLARKRMQLLRTDDYGNVDAKAWTAEIAKFLNSNVLPKLSHIERDALGGRWSDIATDLIEAPAASRTASLEKDLAYNEAMSPTAFEHYCAALLRKGGWICNVTRTSGDQGVDVVATKNGLKVALQCKKYGSPVGNSAVQEVAAARLHVGATVAAVVSNAGYTKSARELAATTKTLLLHYAELPKLDDILAG